MTESESQNRSPTTGSGARHLSIKRACGVVVSLVIIGLLVSWFVAGQLVAPAPYNIGKPPAGLSAKTIELESSNGVRTAGWHVPATQSRGVVILAHGIRANRLIMIDRARFLHSAGYSVVLIDLQAHGESPGKYISLGHLESHNIQAAVDFAKSEHPNEHVAVIGVSLGGASALMASPLGIDAMVLESVFPDIESAVSNRVGAILGPFSPLPTALLLWQIEPRLGISTSQLRPIDFVAKTECPVFFLCGLEDKHTTPVETEQLCKAAVTSKDLWIVEQAAHVDLHAAAPVEYERRVLEFLQKHLSGRAAMLR